MKKIFKVLLILITCIFIISCNNKNNKEEDNTGFDISHEEQFGGINIMISIDDFNNKGFSYGDSINLKLSNGTYVSDIPYYSGYYNKIGEILCVGYQGYQYIVIKENSGDDLYIKYNCNNETKAYIEINEKGKYLDIEEARNLTYYNELDKYPSSEVFANFRNVSIGNIKENILYRGATPVDNINNRRDTVLKLLESNNIKYILDLSNDNILEFIESSDFNSSYYVDLYNNDCVTLCKLDAKYGDSEYSKKICNGLKEMIKHEGPFYIHCVEGKDRTGFVLMVIEALCGASYDEIVNDYMLTYVNYYFFNNDINDPKYQVIVNDVLNPMIEIMTGDFVNIKEDDLSLYARIYLLQGGMTNLEIEALVNLLTK